MPQQQYPVYIYIHGGAYKDGSGNMGYQEIHKDFVSTGLIFVSINYRLGAFGRVNGIMAQYRARECRVIAVSHVVPRDVGDSAFGGCMTTRDTTRHVTPIPNTQ